MIIGKNYEDSRIYRGIKYYDRSPLMSEDVHESMDTIYMKSKYLYDSIIGSGVLNEPNCSIKSDGIHLDIPSVLLLEGDISLIQSDDDVPILSASEISYLNISHGVLCAVAWYQHISSLTTGRKYGGVRNSEVSNGATPDPLVGEGEISQISTRYQLRWDTLVLDYDEYMSGLSLNNYSIINRDANGDPTGDMSTITIEASDLTVRKATKPDNMSYAVSDLYIVPILVYDYNGSVIDNVKSFRAIRPKGSSDVIRNNSTPVANNYSSGTLWYNPTTGEFKFYMKEEDEFLPVYVDKKTIKLVKDTITHTMEDKSEISDLTYSLPSSTKIDDVIQVFYEGIILTPSDNYIIDRTKNTVTLKNFTTRAGEKLVVLCSRAIFEE